MAKKGKKRRKGEKPSQSRPYRLLLPLFNLAEAKALLPLAQALVHGRGGQLIILHVEIVPEGHSLSEAATEVSHFRQAMNRFLGDQGESTSPVRTVVRAAREVWQQIWETVRREEIDVLLLGWQGEALSETAVGNLIDPRLAAPPCDVITVRLTKELTGPEGWQAVHRILFPVRGGPYAGLGLRVAQALAEVADAAITLLHVTGQAPRDAEDRLLATFGPALRGLQRLTRFVTTVGDASQAIVEEAAGFEVVVMGAPARQVHPDGWGGPLLDAVVQSVDTTLVVVKERLPVSRPLVEAKKTPSLGRDRPTAVVVDKWFAERTFRSREFADLESLVAQKDEQGLTISLGLPALNEEKTVGNVIQTVKTALMEKMPLLDEVVLIDSGSVDYTREIAADLGVPVYIHQEILPQYGAYHGKGEALWKSLHVLEGDIVAWIDTDIRNIHQRFVYGILGPLLSNPNIQYVKGFYRRPLRRGDKLVAGGGGRVTELTARPLINLFFPELSSLIQPLSGEYAGRRHALERLPFFTGYGVETGLLIDVLETFGLRAIAQVDLLRRVHHNQPLPSLSKMSFAILQVVVRRLEVRHKLQLMEDVNKTMNLIRSELSRYYLEMLAIQEWERPPMITLPEYRQKRGLTAEPVRDAQAAMEAVGLWPD